MFQDKDLKIITIHKRWEPPIHIDINYYYKLDFENYDFDNEKISKFLNANQ